MKHPTILPIATAHASFVFEDLSTREASLPLIDNSVEISRMNPRCPVPTIDITEGTAQIFQPTPIEVVEVSVGPPGMDQCRDGIDHYRQITFVRLQSLFGLFAIVNIRAGAVPPHDLTGFVAERLGANKEPPINA